jgi:hypothetical protein
MRKHGEAWKKRGTLLFSHATFPGREGGRDVTILSDFDQISWILDRFGQPLHGDFLENVVKSFRKSQKHEKCTKMCPILTLFSRAKSQNQLS